MSLAYEFHLPDIGEGLHEAEILQWFVSVDDVIAKDQLIVEVQTDKAAAEISTPVGGKVRALGGEVGGMVKVGDVLIALDTAESGLDSGVSPVDVGQVAPVHLGNKVLAAPAVRKLARELNVDLAQVPPSDARGHVTKADVEAYAKAAATGGQQTMTPAVKPTVLDRYDSLVEQEQEMRQPIRGLRRRVYENMTRSMYTAPQATGMDELDASRLVEVRERLLPFASAQAIKLTYLPFIIKAVTHVLLEYPIFNASVDDESMEIIYKRHINIGVATATPEGLLVPVIHHVNQKSVFEIAREMEDLARLARERKLTMEHLSGGTFTISSTGANGGWYATPIVNYPEVAILGVHRIAKKPVVLEYDQIVVRHQMGFSLSFDHRVIDGEPVGQFIRRFKEIIEHPELLLAL